MKLVTIVGARPQFIKAAAVSRVLRRNKKITEILLHTGQHFDANMSKVFFDELEIPSPDYNLDVHSLSHGAMTGRMLEKIEEVLIDEKPDAVMVYGDTNSTIAGALAAKKLHLKVAHVEAGMRSFNMRSPEEVNRVLTDRISDLLFCSTLTAMKNLETEQSGRFNGRIIKTGDVMYDAALYYAGKARTVSTIMQSIPFNEFVLCTLHRAENTDDEKTLRTILSALMEIHHETPIVLPLHPRTRKRLENLEIKIPLHIMDPVGYLDMLMLLQHCKMVITDSGGLQKESFFFRKFCITVREETEWVELVELGVNRTVGSGRKKLIRAFHAFNGRKMKENAMPYGKGNASERIEKALLKFF